MLKSVRETVIADGEQVTMQPERCALLPIRLWNRRNLQHVCATERIVQIFVSDMIFHGVTLSLVTLKQRSAASCRDAATHENRG